MKVKYLISTACYLALFLTSFAISTAFAQPGSSDKGKIGSGELICWWPFEADSADFVFDIARQKRDSLYGNFKFVPGIHGNAIKLDGFRTYIRRNPEESNIPSTAFTLESWIALASYPWFWSPVIDCSYPEIKGFFFGIDQEGHLGLKIAAGNTWYELATKKKISLRAWTHVAAVFEPDDKITLFINGEASASLEISGHYIPSRYGTLTLGRNNNPQTWNEFQLTTTNSYFFLDGILDEIKISGRALTEDELKSEYESLTDLPVPALSNREQLPTGPAGSGSFGAFYTKLNYYKEWDDLWRVSDVPDLFVRFDESPVQLVFWRGTSFVPCWVTENGIWYLNEWLETWGRDVVSCAEPIMDRDCRYSHVRLIENTEARVVIHWRYSLNDAFYDFAAISDDGRGEWCDEFHIIYPDQVGVRKMELHYSKPERKHDWVEQIVVLPPGKYPDDVIGKEAIS
ncbi:MAG: LamG domain-containing protein, partial [Bacteroidetes bacterium]|nr:LamG domain-containing protein [Bacteroidota bacterium]